MNTRVNRKVQHQIDDANQLSDRRHAVVLGGSLAGFLAARVLSSFEVEARYGRETS